MPMPRIKCVDLPPRPRALQSGELTKVFGGCKGQGGVCAVDSDCCSGRKCNKGAVYNPGGILSFVNLPYLSCN
jgi:hypothetical protein